VCLDTLFARLVLTRDKFRVNLLEATNLAQVLVLKLFLVNELSSKDNWCSISLLDLLLHLLFSNLNKSVKLSDHLFKPLHDVQLTRGALVYD
jgi:hypothetical protein